MKKQIEEIIYKYHTCIDGGVEGGISDDDFDKLINDLNDLFMLTDVVGHSEQLRFLIDKFQTPKGNYLIELLMAEKERKDKKP